MGIRRACLTVLAAVLTGISVFGSSPPLQAQQPVNELPFNELRVLAEQGDADAQYDLAFAYGRGGDVPVDVTELVRWLQLAADQGHMEAQYDLGSLFDRGLLGVPQDATEALRLIRLAADQGHKEAQYGVGLKYSGGKGVPQDATEAIRWLRLAADQGHVNAQFMAGYMLWKGDGIPTDYIEAHMWLNLCAAQPSEQTEIAAEARDSIASLLTSDQIAEAQRRAREWKPEE